VKHAGALLKNPERLGIDGEMGDRRLPQIMTLQPSGMDIQIIINGTGLLSCKMA